MKKSDHEYELLKRYVTLIIDLQYGSTGKGLIAGFLAESDQPDTILTAWAANAGHTYINHKGKKYVHSMLPNGVVSKALKRIMMGPGSIIDPDILLKEILSCSEELSVNNAKIYIHCNAAVITEDNRNIEKSSMYKIGSTMKGVGNALIKRIERDPDSANIAAIALQNHPVMEYVTVVNTEEYLELLHQGRTIMIEGAQGYSLSMYHGQYPYCTSRDISTHQILADCGVPFNWHATIEVVGTARTYPIRVANRYDENGNMIGYSGPCYPDQREISFNEINQPVEYTTVTKLPRRIFTFSPTQIKEALVLNGVDRVFLNFANYCDSKELDGIINTIEQNDVPVSYLGYGPSVKDIQIRPLSIQK